MSADLTPIGAHPLTYPDDEWTDPITGQTIPKTIAANLAARKRLLVAAEDDERLQGALVAMCRSSCLFWINLFAWTFRQQYVDSEGITRTTSQTCVPMITWPVQDAAIDRLIAAVLGGGGDVVVDKSRDMGASWICLLAFTWLWLFRPDTALGVMSRREDDVDKAGNPKALLWKVDYAVDRLPVWMQPRRARAKLHLANLDTGSVIDGESTSGHAFRGDRRTALMIDEAAAIDNLRQIILSTDAVTPCRIFNSTPTGPNAYSQLRYSGRVQVIVLPWWDHPEKGVGRQLVDDAATGTKAWTSPFYARETARKSPREVAQNLDMDHGSAGSMFFAPRILNRIRGKCVLPTLVGEIEGVLPYGQAEDTALQRLDQSAVRFRRSVRGHWRLWCRLERDSHGAMRPSQERPYVFGADVSWGVGASNSTIVAFDAETGVQVGGYACASVDPQAFARVLVRAAIWFGGMGPVPYPYMAWEANGPGQVLAPAIKTLGYPLLYRHTPLGQQVEHKTPTLGWVSNRESKLQALANLEAEVARDSITLLDEALVDEMGTYVFFESGEIGPGHLEGESAEAARTHGDRVIGAMVAILARVSQQRVKPTEFKAPYGSVAWELEQRERKRRAREW